MASHAKVVKKPAPFAAKKDKASPNKIGRQQRPPTAIANELKKYRAFKRFTHPDGTEGTMVILFVGHQ
jgi:hypothetical protein